ncbi:EpsG family protein [Yeosuana aromativorans]|uniref:EpsG family protein n=1 Tax=Yeosuana aromativorans TaxID=288019 RepID=UPI001668BB95|nr:EpsG family protein [Yeosuana aromativorans]
MLIYILFYLFVFSLLLFGKYKVIKGVNFYWLTYFFIFLFSAFRYDVGYDFMYYYKILDKSIKYYDNMFNRLEFLNKIIINFSQDINFLQLYFIATSFLIVFLIYKTVKFYSKDFIISTLIFLSFPIFYFNSFSIIRQFVAISIVFYSFKFVKSKKLFSFLLSIFIAFFFHKSAVLALPIYWIYRLKLKNIHFIIIYFVGLFSSEIAYYAVKFIIPEYMVYLEKRIGVGGDKLLIIFQIIGFFLLFLVNKKKGDNNYNFYITSFFIGLFIWSSLSPYGHAGFRGGLYFIVFFILLLPEVLEIIKEKKLLKYTTYCICFIFFVFTLWIGTQNPHKDPNIPYRVYFLTDKNEFKIDKR